MIRELTPDAFVLENVQGLTYKTHAPQFARLLSQLATLGYNPTWRVLLAAEYGVPQLRRRVFVVGRRDGVPFQFPQTTHSGFSERDRGLDPTKAPFMTAHDAIGDLITSTPEPGEVVDGEFGDLAAEVPAGQNYLCIQTATAAEMCSDGVAGIGRSYCDSIPIGQPPRCKLNQGLGRTVSLGERRERNGDKRARRLRIRSYSA